MERVDFIFHFLPEKHLDFFLEKNKRTYPFIREIGVGLIAGSDYI